MTQRTALVTGVTGYLGPLLVERLLDADWRVRVVARDASRLDDAPWIHLVDVVEGDLSDVTTVDEALDGVDVAYYLVHAMGDAFDYSRADHALAQTFADGATRAHVGRIVYLGGLHPHDRPLTPHLASRREVGQVFLDSAVPAAVLQAGMVIGRGSASFEMLRWFTRRVPAAVVPTWIDHEVQPIAVGDVLHYLVAAADLAPDVNRVLDVGGTDVVRYRDLVDAVADATGRHRVPMLAVPILLPRTASLWAGILTPGSSTLNAALVHSLTMTMVCDDDEVSAYLPRPPGGLSSVRESIDAALSA